MKLLILVAFLVLFLVGCGASAPADPPFFGDEAVVVATIKGRSVYRFHDREEGVICYTFPWLTISCVAAR